MSINIAYANIGAHIALSERSMEPLWDPELPKRPEIMNQWLTNPDISVRLLDRIVIIIL